MDIWPIWVGSRVCHLCQASSMSSLTFHVDNVSGKIFELFHSGPERHDLAAGVFGAERRLWRNCRGQLSTWSKARNYIWVCSLRQEFWCGAILWGQCFFRGFSYGCFLGRTLVSDRLDRVRERVPPWVRSQHHVHVHFSRHGSLHGLQVNLVGREQ